MSNVSSSGSLTTASQPTATITVTVTRLTKLAMQAVPHHSEALAAGSQDVFAFFVCSPNDVLEQLANGFQLPTATGAANTRTTNGEQDSMMPRWSMWGHRSLLPKASSIKSCSTCSQSLQQAKPHSPTPPPPLMMQKARQYVFSLNDVLEWACNWCSNPESHLHRHQCAWRRRRANLGGLHPNKDKHHSRQRRRWHLPLQCDLRLNQPIRHQLQPKEGRMTPRNGLFETG